MKKFFLSAAILAAFILYVFLQRGKSMDSSYVEPSAVVSTVTPSPSSPSSDIPMTSDVPVTTPPTTNTANTRPATTTPTSTPPTPPASKPSPAPTPTPAPKPVPKNTNQYKDGVFTGSGADAYYGTIQVEAVIQNGKITDVVFLEYPQDRSTSIMINRQAMVYLKSEAIQAQSANVDIVSGATDSSIAFRESLTSALAQAKNI